MATAAPISSPEGLEQPALDALAQGRLLYPKCRCGHAWLPVSPECPNCLYGDRWTWTQAGGTGTVESWVVYHVAYHPSVKDKLPYNVAIVSLDEGPRLGTNILAPLKDIRIGLRVVLKVEFEGDAPVARFAPMR